MPETTREKRLPWIPAILCAAIAGMVVILDLALVFATGRKSEFGLNIFMMNLPVVFYIVGAAITDLKKQIAELKQQVAELQQEMNVPVEQHS